MIYTLYRFHKYVKEGYYLHSKHHYVECLIRGSRHIGRFINDIMLMKWGRDEKDRVVGERRNNRRRERVI